MTSSDCRTVSRAIQAVPTMVSQISPLFHTSTVRPRSRRLISLQRPEGAGRGREERNVSNLGGNELLTCESPPKYPSGPQGPPCRQRSTQDVPLWETLAGPKEREDPAPR